MADKIYHIEDSFIHLGYPCIVTISNVGFRCGYVGLGPWNIFFNKKYDTVQDMVETSVHGGLTFGEFRKSFDDIFHTTKYCWDFFWIGFDCAHYVDKIDRASLFEHFYKHAQWPHRIPRIFRYRAQPLKGYESTASVKTTNFVKAECERLAEQIDTYMRRHRLKNP